MKNDIAFLNKNTPNILIVDDMPDNLKVLGNILKSEGYKVRPVPNGMLALQVADKEKPDLILLDIMMPVMDGFEVCRQLKENPKLKEIPVIFISALSDITDIAKAFAAGGVDYVNKPFQVEEIKALVATHLKLRQQSKMIQQLNAEKDKFFSIISKDLSNPFNNFLGLTQKMNKELSSINKEKILEMAMIMQNSAAKLYHLLENLQEWTKLQHGLISFSPKEIELFPIIEECISVELESAKMKGIKIINEVLIDSYVCADINMLRTIIRNLISNAVKFTPKGGNISVFAKRLGDKSTEVSVSDSGIGMNEEMIENLFKIEINTNRSGTEGEPYSGLGLLISKEFVEKHGGILNVNSKENIGSVFSFVLPFNELLQVKSNNKDKSFFEGDGNHIKNLKILIVEDNEELAMLISLAVKRFSREVLKAKNGLEAVDVCSCNTDIDLILMDIQMPVMDGHEATTQIRLFNKEVVIIAQTAFALSDDKEKALKAGCNDYISKPIKQDKLMEIMRSYFKVN
ncbi:MAG: response regulator [Bacteroidetes bacterium]|nr:response regulator [Bacteroidota bacterium]